MNELEKIVENVNISEKNKTELINIYKMHHAKSKILVEKVSTIIVENENDTETIELAETTRKELKKIRCAVDKNRKLTNEEAQLFVTTNNSIAKATVGSFLKLEEYLLTQENFVQIKNENRIVKMIADRTDLLNEISNNCYQLELHQYDLRLMSKEKFEKILKFEKLEAKNALNEHKKKLAKEKIEREEIKELRVENTKLKADAIKEIKRKHYKVPEKNLDVFATDEEIFENWRQGLVDYITDNIITITDNKLCELVDDICYAINREVNQDAN